MSSHETIDERWAYNCEDTVRTLECADEELSILAKFGLEKVNLMQQEMLLPVLHAMIRGVKIDLIAREAMRVELDSEMIKLQAYFKYILGHDLNPRSPKQMMGLFYEDLQQKVIFTRAKKGIPARPTLDDNALELLGVREPLLKPIIKNIQEYRSLGVFKGTFVEAELDVDDRMRCSYNICGTETYRLSSSENAFGSGTNLQNIPKGTKAKEVDDLELPNIRKIFVPDESHTFFDADLDRADLQVVVWEADDADLKLALRMGIDMHCMSACDIWNIKGIPYDELVETHPNYLNHRATITEDRRDKAKRGVHATDYGVQAPTLAQHLKCSIREAQAFIDGWYARHPGIKKWRDRTEVQLNTKRFVENKYGYRRFYFGRIEHLLPEALAWIPQSTVAITINQVWLNIFRQVPKAEVLLQVHDSLCGQFPTDDPSTLSAMRAASLVTIPYDDPLIIPIGFKTSTESWGACK